MPISKIYIRVEVKGGITQTIKSSESLSDLKNIDQKFAPQTDDIRVFDLYQGDNRKIEHGTEIWSHPNRPCISCDNYSPDEEMIEYKGDKWDKSCHKEFMDSLK